MKLAFLIDPIAALDPTHDSTVALMEAAQLRGHEVWFGEISDLSVHVGDPLGLLRPLKIEPVQWLGDRWQVASPWYTAGEAERRSLHDFDAVFMRKDPPVTTAYLYATYLLDLVNPKKTRVVNSPEGLRHANEKMYALQFQSVVPRTLVSSNKTEIRAFLDELNAAVLKPLGGKAGEGILFLDPGDRNFNSLVEISTQQGQLPVMVQQYLPEAKDGDKRIILVNGEPLGAVNRVPTGREFRGNMAVGGRVEAVPITDRDREICAAVAPRLQRDGLFFVGIDVIGGYLTEVNVTSPTGIREIDRLNGVSIGDQTIAALEAMLNRG
ncbi:glutathione synthase [Synechococcus elongatus IITB4]|uniref:glutathione synthase n=1 Tax=Synechococcus elongatus TaxID=32046 RepID=UPI0030CF7E1B